MSIDTASGSYERAIIIANNGRSNAGRYASQIEELPLPRIEVPTERTPDASLEDDVRYLWDRMYKVIEPGDVMVVPSGDGFLHYVANGLMQDEAVERGLSWTPLLSVPEGNACDIGRQLIGEDSLRTVLYEGRAWDLKPIEVRTSHHEEGGSVRRALGYFSIGGTAAAAEDLDGLKHSNNPFARFRLTRRLIEPFVTLRSVVNAPGIVFENTETRLPQDRFRTDSDRLYVRGNRIAKYGHPHADLTRDEFEEFRSYPNGYGETLLDMAKMQRGWLPGDMKQSESFIVWPRHRDRVIAQFDGERAFVRAGSRVSVGISEITYRALATRLRGRTL